MSHFNPNKVNLMNCFCFGNAHLNDRYSLTLDLNPTNSIGKEAIVIMKNPASTAKANVFHRVSFQNLCDVDRTTSRVINVIHMMGYDKLITLNIFPYYDNNPKVLNSIYTNLNMSPSFNNNLNEIQNILQTYSNADIICAWGHKSNMSRNLFDSAILQVLPLINGRNKFEYIKNNPLQNRLRPLPNIISTPIYPLHPQRW